jgi:hypothetical protein
MRSAIAGRRQVRKRRQFPAPDEAIFITGSLFLLAEARGHFRPGH